MKKLILVMAAVVFSTSLFAERIKDLTTIAGVRSNQLVGYGLVVGLEGTGANTGNKEDFASQSLRSLLNNFGVQIPVDIDPKSKNIAAVAIHADLPPFAKIGQTIDITVSTLGDAKSIRGGSLLMAPLKGADGQVYAIAQGSLVVSGFGAQGADGSRVSLNFSNVGRIPNGATVERIVPNAFTQGDSITLNLNHSDFSTARSVAEVINNLLGNNTAMALDATSIRVRAPRHPSQRVSFMSVLENLEVTPAREVAKIIINSRTGTIVIGQDVRVSPVAVTHGGLTVTITENLDVNQPNALAGGNTIITPRTGIDVDAGSGHMFNFQGGTSLQQIVDAVNQVGAAPGDLMAILEALKQSGAIKAEFLVI